MIQVIEGVEMQSVVIYMLHDTEELYSRCLASSNHSLPNLSMNLLLISSHKHCAASTGQWMHSERKLGVEHVLASSCKIQ